MIAGSRTAIIDEAAEGIADLISVQGPRFKWPPVGAIACNGRAARFAGVVHASDIYILGPTSFRAAWDESRRDGALIRHKHWPAASNWVHDRIADNSAETYATRRSTDHRAGLGLVDQPSLRSAQE